MTPMTLSPPKPGGRPRPPAPTAAGYAWLALGMLGLTVYGSLIPFQFRPRPLDEAVELFRGMAAFQPSLLEPRGDWVVSLVQFLVLSYLTMAALSVDHSWDVGVGAAVLVVPACVALG